MCFVGIKTPNWTRFIFLKKYFMKNVERRVPELLDFQNFLEGMPPEPLYGKGLVTALGLVAEMYYWP